MRPARYAEIYTPSKNGQCAVRSLRSGACSHGFQISRRAPGSRRFRIFLGTKAPADAHFLRLAQEHQTAGRCVLRPSLVIGRGGASTELFQPSQPHYGRFAWAMAPHVSRETAHSPQRPRLNFDFNPNVAPTELVPIFIAQPDGRPSVVIARFGINRTGKGRQAAPTVAQHPQRWTGTRPVPLSSESQKMRSPGAGFLRVAR